MKKQTSTWNGWVLVNLWVRRLNHRVPTALAIKFILAIRVTRALEKQARGGTGYGGADFGDIGRELTLKTGHREAMSYTTWHGVLYDHS